ncbi:MAG: SRPBCC family protein [Ignavibacteriae bacterium]|nr:SRPBCC family protein [Ignavibacteriota bacterium]
MNIRTIHAQIDIPLPIQDVFIFFSDARNLEAITPPELRFRVESQGMINIIEGTEIQYTLGLFGIRFRWRSRISCWDPPRSFVDEQLQGPYALWHHEHQFEEIAGGTQIRDTVHYALPLWPFSAPAHPLVRAQLRRIFEYRQTRVIRLFKVAAEQCPWSVRL